MNQGDHSGYQNREIVAAVAGDNPRAEIRVAVVDYLGQPSIEARVWKLEGGFWVSHRKVGMRFSVGQIAPLCEALELARKRAAARPGPA